VKISNHVPWTPERIEVIEALMDTPWVGQGAAAIAIGRSRATVHNMMGSGDIRWARLGGSRHRSAFTPDLLLWVLADMEADKRLGVEMGACSDHLIESVRRSVRTNEQARPSEHNTDRARELAIAVRRSLAAKRRLASRTNAERTPNERRTNEPANEGDTS
jgi:hypothetical protein